MIKQIRGGNTRKIQPLTAGTPTAEWLEVS